MLNVNKNGGGGDGMMRPFPNSGCSSTTSSMSSSATGPSVVPVPCLQLCCFGWLQSLDQFIGGNNDSGGGTLASSSPHKQLQQRRQCSSSASTGGTPASVAAAQQRVDAGVAIDSKIEQAMDLVKTHLIYAVRDEIEMLRSRIVQLETTVVQLERENAQLREFVPHEVLASLCLLDQQAVGQHQSNLNKVPSSPAGFAKTVPTAAAAAAAAIVQ